MSSNDGVYDFNKQMVDGDYGENTFYAKFEDELLKGVGKDPDFIIKSTNDLLELKTDTWKHADKFDYGNKSTPNLFMEYYSDKNRETIGGPWRSKKENCRYFAYFFMKNNIFYLFETTPLVQLLEYLVKGMCMKDIPNKGWVTSGYAIDKKYLEPLSIVCNMGDNVSLSEVTSDLEQKLANFNVEKYALSI